MHEPRVVVVPEITRTGGQYKSSRLLSRLRRCRKFSPVAEARTDKEKDLWDAESGL